MTIALRTGTLKAGGSEGAPCRSWTGGCEAESHASVPVADVGLIVYTLIMAHLVTFSSFVSQPSLLFLLTNSYRTNVLCLTTHSKSCSVCLQQEGKAEGLGVGIKYPEHIQTLTAFRIWHFRNGAVSCLPLSSWSSLSSTCYQAQCSYTHYGHHLEDIPSRDFHKVLLVSV